MLSGPRGMAAQSPDGGASRAGLGDPQVFDESQEDSEVVRTVCGVWARMRAPSHSTLVLGT